MTIPWQDSLYAHHSYASHYPQKLDQVVSTYLDASPWKIRFGRRDGVASKLDPEEMTGEQLCEYNAADCRVTIKAFRALGPDLAKEIAVYEHDLALAELCTGMTFVGIRIDRARQRLLARKLTHSANALREKMRGILKDPYFQPNKIEHVRRALFETLQVRKIALTSTGKASTGKAVIEALRAEDTLRGAIRGVAIRSPRSPQIQNNLHRRAMAG